MGDEIFYLAHGKYSKHEFGKKRISLPQLRADLRKVKSLTC